MVHIVNSPTYKDEDFSVVGKKPGISAIVRLRNESEFLNLSLSSIIPYMDEIIIVYNNCDDDTPQIVAEWAKREPEKIKAFHYVPVVFPPGSSEYLSLPTTHPSSLIHFYNFALSKISYSICTKWDGDMVAVGSQLSDLIKKVKSEEFSNSSVDKKDTFWWFSGINLWKSKGKLFVRSELPRSGTGDIGFWKVNSNRRFIHDLRYEVLNKQEMKSEFIGWIYFHLKGVKKDRGVSNYELERYPDSRYKLLIEQRDKNLNLITLRKFYKKCKEASVLGLPKDVGIRLENTDTNFLISINNIICFLVIYIFIMLYFFS